MRVLIYGHVCIVGCVSRGQGVPCVPVSGLVCAYLLCVSASLSVCPHSMCLCMGVLRA